MEKQEIINEILGLPVGEQREILEMLRERIGAAESGEGSAPKGPEKKRVDPWGSVYNELAKTFRRPATR